MKKGSTDIHTLRTRWMDQIKATNAISLNLSRKQKRISGRAGRVAWKIMQLELASLCRLRHRRIPVSRSTTPPDTFSTGYGVN
ncbi:hypothetical protein IACHDJAJ_00089 [Aeromonas phage vB_AdhS_TS3]|nr:hypothetical protein IACHDJAJ_00089 [Aeromonas phage vB_AdhS_TS3]